MSVVILVSPPRQTMDFEPVASTRTSSPTSKFQSHRPSSIQIAQRNGSLDVPEIITTPLTPRTRERLDFSQQMQKKIEMSHSCLEKTKIGFAKCLMQNCECYIQKTVSCCEDGKCCFVKDTQLVRYKNKIGNIKTCASILACLTTCGVSLKREPCCCGNSKVVPSN